MDLARVYAEIVETGADGIWVIDLDGRTRYANEAMAELVGVPLDQMPRTTVFDTLDATGRDQFRLHLEEARRGVLNEGEVEGQLVRPDGSHRWARISERPLLAADGTIDGLLHRYTDITEQRATLAALRRTQEHLLEAQRIARVGSWTLDLDTQRFEASDGLRFLVGLPEGVPPTTLASVLTIIHPDDIALLLGELEAATQRDEHTFVVRARGAGGEWLWIRLRGRPVGGPGSRRLTGGALDITESMDRQRDLRDQVAQNAFMEGVASAANEASSMLEMLHQTRQIVVVHDDWTRARGFSFDDGQMVPAHSDEAERADDEEHPERMRLERDLAERSAAAGTPVWDESGRVIACAIRHADEVVSAFVITSAHPPRRRAMVEDLIRQAAVLVSRVAERESSARALAAARDDAMAASRQKSDFLAMVSHEIRTPLNGVVGLGDLLLDTDLDEDQRRLASGVELSGRTLLRLINDILDFSKIEAGHLELEHVDFDVRAIVHQATEPHVSAAVAKGLTVEVRVAPDVPEVVNGDPTRYSQVLGNLMSNAVKFTETGRVDVLVSRVASDGRSDLATEVHDTGIGLGADRASLFEPFRQGDVSTTRIFGGTGLGLAICRELVHALGGEIDVDSEPGEGTRFRFTGSFSSPRGGEVLGRLRDRDERRGPLLDGRARVLVVEDHPVNQMVAVGMLESWGCTVAVAGDGEAALAELGRATYDLVLMDVHMPGIDGYETTRTIRAAEPDGRHLPVVAMTASAIDGELERCREAGMDDLVSKPVDPRQLRRVVARWARADEPAPNPEVIGPPPASGRTDPTESRAVVLDTDRLAELEASAPGYVDRALASMRERLPRHREEIRAALAAGDGEAARAAAHLLAGGADNVGLVEVARVAREVEELCLAVRVEEARTLEPRLDQAVLEARRALDRRATGGHDGG